MEKLSQSELHHEMNGHGCFNATYVDTPICKKLYSQLNTSVFHRRNDDYSHVGNFVFASYALAIFLNLALLWLMYKDPLKKFRTPTAVLMANLAVSDLHGAVFGLVIHTEVTQNQLTSDVTTLYLPWLVVTMAQCSYYTVIMISIERYIAVAFPIRYRSVVLMKYVIAAIVIFWLLSFVVSTPLYFGQHRHKVFGGENYFFAINTFILVTVILVLYPLTYSSLRNQRKRLLTMNANNSHLRNSKLKVEQSFANTMLLVYASLILFHFPYVVVFVYYVRKCNSCLLDNIFLHIWTYFRIAYTIHYGVNPIIYALRLPSYKHSLMHFSPRKKRRDLGANGPSLVPSNGTQKAYSINATMAETQA